MPDGRPATRDDIAHLEAALRTALEELRRLRIDVSDVTVRLQRIERLLTRTDGPPSDVPREGSQ